MTLLELNSFDPLINQNLKAFELRIHDTEMSAERWKKGITESSMLTVLNCSTFWGQVQNLPSVTTNVNKKVLLHSVFKDRKFLHYKVNSELENWEDVRNSFIYATFHFTRTPDVSPCIFQVKKIMLSECSNCWHFLCLAKNKNQEPFLNNSLAIAHRL